MGESYIPGVFFDPLLHRSLRLPAVDVATLTKNSVDNASLFIRVDSVLRSHQVALNVNQVSCPS